VVAHSPEEGSTSSGGHLEEYVLQYHAKGGKG